jgi:membrane fusion protein (multidrug efflux system)
VGQGAPVIELVNTDRIEVEVNMPELDVKYFKPSQQVMVTVDAYPEKKFIGEIDFVAFKADGVTKTFRVKILVGNEEGLIRPGMMVRTVMLRRIVPDALAAPLFSLLDKGGERVLFVEEDGRAQSRVVQLGIIDGDRIQVLEGLEPGDHLIVTGQTQVEDGIKVVVQ